MSKKEKPVHFLFPCDKLKKVSQREGYPLIFTPSLGYAPVNL